MSAIPAAPGEERLRLRAAWQGMTGARKSRVLALLGLAAVILAVLVYGIATSGRAARQAAPVAPDLAPGGGGEWLSQIPDRPRGKVQEPSPAAVQTPVTPTKKETAATPPTTLPPASTVGPASGATGAKPLTPEEQYRLEKEKKRHEALLAALVERHRSPG